MGMNILTDLVLPPDTRIIVCFVLWETGRGALNHSKGRQTLNRLYGYVARTRGNESQIRHY